MPLNSDDCFVNKSINVKKAEAKIIRGRFGGFFASDFHFSFKIFFSKYALVRKISKLSDLLSGKAGMQGIKGWGGGGGGGDMSHAHRWLVNFRLFRLGELTNSQPLHVGGKELDFDKYFPSLKMTLSVPAATCLCVFAFLTVTLSVTFLCVDRCMYVFIECECVLLCV